MKVKFSPQVNDFDTLEYSFREESILVKLNDKEDLFDFTGMPDGVVSNMETDLDYNPVISVEKKDGDLFIELMKFVKVNDSEDEFFPGWQEVKLDG